MAAAGVSEDDLNRLIEGFGRFVEQQRDRYYPSGMPLSSAQKKSFTGFFSDTLLEQSRITLLQGERIPSAPESLVALVRQGADIPDVLHMSSFTYLDVVVFQEPVSDRRLFHALVHTAQFAILGLRSYLELYIKAFLRTRKYITVPLEVQAFGLDARFAESGSNVFSVEEDVRLWMTTGRYLLS